MEPIKPAQSAAFDVLTSGREFYDDGYTEEEQNTVDLPSTYRAVSVNNCGNHIGSHAVKPNDEHDSSLPATSTATTEATAETIDQPFFGRTAELRKLDSIRRMIISNNNVNGNGHHRQQIPSIYPAVLVWGTSGTGKSCMVERFINETCCTCDANVTHAPAPVSTDGNDSHPNTNDTSNHKPHHCSCCYVLRGKFDEGTGGSEPFSGIIQALNDLATQLKHGPPEEIARMRLLVRDTFNSSSSSNTATEGDSATIGGKDSDNTKGQNNSSFRRKLAGLTALVPSLSILLTDGTTPASPSIISHSAMPASWDDQLSVASGSASISPSIMSSTHRSTVYGQSAPGGTSQNAWNRLQYVFIQFMKAISTPTKPVYLFLDDLQWSSSAGLDLLATMIADPDLRSFMLLGAIRQDTDPHNDEIVELEADAALRTSFLDRLVSSGEAANNETAAGQKRVKGSRKEGCIKNGSEQQGQRQQPDLEQITITNLSINEMTHWLSDMFDRPQDDPDLLVLTRKLRKKTRGNVFFTLQAIEELKRKNIIVFSRITFMWEWNLPTKNKNRTSGLSASFRNDDGFHDRHDGNDDDDDDIDDLPISDNIVAAIENQLRQLPDDVQHVLSIAAYIRARFDLVTLHKVLGHASSRASAWTQSKVISTLQQAVTERLIIKSTTTTHRYQFAHDRIQQAAYGLVPYGETRDKLRVKIGHCLLDLYTEAQEFDHIDLGNQYDRTNVGPLQMEDSQERSSHDHSLQDHSHPSQQDDTLLFVAADHLNSVQTKDHMFSVTMNLRVGEKALQMAALGSAAGYLHKASIALKRVRQPWEDHYDLSLRLCQVRAEAELSLGHFEVGYKLGNEVFERAKTLDEKLQTYFSIANALGRENKYVESLAVSTRAARLLHLFPRRFYPIQIVRDILKIKSYLKSHSDEEILGLPLMDDYRTEMAMQIACEVAHRSTLVNDPIPFLLLVCKMIKITIKHGICEASALGFCGFGVLFDNVLNDFDSAMRCTDIAQRIMDMTNGGQLGGLVDISTNEFFYRFNRPKEEVDHLVCKAHYRSMQAGEFEAGLRMMQFRFGISYFQNRTLQELSDSIGHTMQQSRIYRVASLDEISDSYLRLSQSMAGLEKVDWARIETQATRDLKTDPPDPSLVYETKFDFFVSASVAYHSGKHELANRLMKLFRGVGNDNESYILQQIRFLMSGLAASAMYRKTKKRTHKRKLRSQITSLKDIEKTKGSTLRLCRLLLEAEAQSLSDSKGDRARIQQVLDAYDTAIQVALDESSMQITALGYELAAEHLIRSKQQARGTRGGRQLEDTVPDDAIRQYLVKALEQYHAWGCRLKIDHIRQCRSRYVQDWHPFAK